MAFKKRKSSKHVDIAQNRIEGIRQVDPEMDFGNGISIAEYQKRIDDVRETMKAYNSLMTQADGLLFDLDSKVHEIQLYNTRILNSVGGKYGYDSIPYEMAGGKRNSDIKHHRRKKTDDEKKIEN